jgi:hypothetical protein
LPKEYSSTDAYGFPIGDLEDPKQKGSKNDFSQWLRNPGTQAGGLKSGAAMNCWEAVLTSAYYGKLVDKNQIVALCNKTSGKKEKDRTRAFLNVLGRNVTNPIKENSPPPKPGDIILIDNDKNVGFHVFIAGKEQEVFSRSEGEDVKAAFAFSHDRSDSVRSKVYNPDPFSNGPTFDPFSLNTPCSDSMVHRNLKHIVTYTKDALEGSTKQVAEIRYLSPKVFEKLPK